MSKNKQQQNNNMEANEQELDTTEIINDDIENGASPDTTLADEEDARHKIDELTAQIEKDKKEYLFLMADFDNYRKRVLKEKAEILKNAGEKVLKGLLPIVDDFERGLSATQNAAEDAAQVREGMELIYNKLIKYLESNGVKAMKSTGETFDADFHEAIATVPAPSPDLKGKVLDTTQKGYMLNDKVLRHAKVAVGE